MPARRKPFRLFTMASCTLSSRGPLSRRWMLPLAICFGNTNARCSANVASSARTKSLAIFQNVLLYTAPDSFVVGLDAVTGEMKWETKTEGRGHTSGPIVAEGKVISGGACSREAGKLLSHGPRCAYGQGNLAAFIPLLLRGSLGMSHGTELSFAKSASLDVWGLPGTYDPVRKMLYWGIANPMPDQRALRHNGDPDGTSRSAPSDLYSNSTVALDQATGKLAWYYQHLPGDDWDSDYTHGAHAAADAMSVSPDPKFVKWINPDIPKGEERDVAVTVGEAGGIFELDRATGQFLWATPFPYDDPNFVISDIDVKTGKTTLNWNLVFKQPGGIITWFAIGIPGVTDLRHTTPAQILLRFLHRPLPRPDNPGAGGQGRGGRCSLVLGPIPRLTPGWQRSISPPVRCSGMTTADRPGLAQCSRPPGT